MNRSFVHMLEIAAARLENNYANPKLIADLREKAEALAKKTAEGCDYDPREQKRVDRQRTLFTMVPDSTAKRRLQEAMLQRLYDLMWDGDGTSADALAEFLPSMEVEKVFEAWERDSGCNAALEFSKWYSGQMAA